MDEYRLQDIWKKNLREFQNLMRLDSIIIKAMQEAAEEARKEQLKAFAEHLDEICGSEGFAVNEIDSFLEGRPL